jgi:hypothetical protein
MTDDEIREALRLDFEQTADRQIGFQSWPETAEDFVKACIADRAMGA